MLSRRLHHPLTRNPDTCSPGKLVAPHQNFHQHGGFKPLAALVNAGASSPAERNTKLLWGVALLSFFLSAVLDNLTTTIVMLSVMQVTAVPYTAATYPPSDALAAQIISTHLLTAGLQS